MNLFSIFAVVIIFIGGFTLLSYNLDDISENNPNLDQESLNLIAELQQDIDTNLQLDDVDTITSNLTENSTNEGTADFSREFRQSRSETGSQANRIQKVTTIPSIVVKSMGIPQNVEVAFLLRLIGVVLGFIIILALYIAWKTGEVKDP